MNHSEKELWWLRVITKWNRQAFALLMLVLSGSAAYSQCACAENFEFVYSKVKLNYAGWTDKTTPDPQGFATFTQQQRLKAQAETNPDYCYKIISNWLDYFKDRHTNLYHKNQNLNLDGKPNEKIRAHVVATETIALSEQQVKEQIDASNAIEGIWKNEGYTVAIIKNKNAYRDYAAIILKADSVYWMPGQVKMELEEKNPGQFEVLFYMRDHSLRLSTAKVAGNVLEIEGLSSFTKTFPQASVQSVISERISTEAELQWINPNTFYLRLPTFNHHVKENLDSILLANHDRLITTPNLIIDVRNNGGGSDITYADVIQYLYTHPINMVNNSILSTPDNIAKFEAILNDPQYPKQSKTYIRKLVNELKAHPNTFYRKKDNTLKLKKTLANPKQIVVLINGGCASSCEEFVLAAKQSKKVTLMGDNTMGVLDYANIHTLDLPCVKWGLQYATSRTNRLPHYPIDNIGIKPAIKIPKEVNWIEFAIEYFNSK